MMTIWDKVLDFLTQTAGNNIVDHWKKNSSVDAVISDLRSALRNAHLLIERSECWRLPLNGPIDKLLPELKEAVYEAESMVHEFVYQDLKNEVKKPSSGTIFLENWMNDFPNKVKKAFDDLDKIIKEMKNTCDNLKIPENPNEFSKNARPITVKVPSTTVYGREDELDQILKLIGVLKAGRGNRSRNVNVSNLKGGEASHVRKHEGNFSVLSIVGMGGVGKTTLAQMICNDKRVKRYFDPIMWVCVSDNFVLLKFIKEIFESASKKACDLTNLDTMSEQLENALNSKRFLLVLDDVWSQDWQSVLGPLKGAGQGSIVMVTTRSKKFVKLSDTSIHSINELNLEGLQEDIYWNFFKSCANLNNDPVLEGIGREICGRLKGSPLAAKTIGGLLSTNMDATNWMTIKESAMWQLNQEESDILPVLQLSYQYLPSCLKKCFSFCALYPKDFKFTKWELKKLWIMQGFINLPELTACSREPPIKEADDYFHELVQRCFFQKAAGSSIKKKAAGSDLDEYVIHDLMHDVCQSITKDECFCVEYEDHVKSISNRNIRHLSIFQKGMKKKEPEWLQEYKKLISVRWGPGRSCHIKTIDKWCETLTCIRSLSLSKCKIAKLPDRIGSLKHLQYLDISFTPIAKLPGSFCDLYNLLYLNMENCRLIKSVPEGFSRLVNLRFICFWPDYLILVDDMKNFASAIEVKDIYICLDGEMKIGNLKHVNKIRGSLSLTEVQNIPSKKDAEEADLKNKPLIKKLYFHWSKWIPEMSSVQRHHHQDVLEGLWPHHNLESLHLVCHSGRNLPSWFKDEFLPNLTEIRLESCKRLRKVLEPDQFRMLKIIYIVSCYELNSLPVHLFEGFASLTDLTIIDCPKLTCSNAMVLPPSIVNLELGSCGDLEKSIPSCLINLTSLSKLRIKRCPSLVSIPADIASNLKSLCWLSVSYCAELQSLGGLDASVRVFYIWMCPKLSQTRSRPHFIQQPGAMDGTQRNILPTPTDGNRSRRTRKRRLSSADMLNDSISKSLCSMENMFGKASESIAKLADCFQFMADDSARRNAEAAKRDAVSEELKKLPGLSPIDRIRAGATIAGDSNKINFYFSLSDDDKLEYVNWVLGGCKM